MSRLSVLPIVAILAAVPGCDLSLTSALPCGAGDGLRPPLVVSSGASFKLGLGETAVVRETCLTVRFDAVPEDSRCPLDVECPSAGNARVALTLLPAGGEPSGLELNTLLEPRAGTAAGHAVALLDLTPMPEAGRPIPPDEVRAKLRVDAPQ